MEIFVLILEITVLILELIAVGISFFDRKRKNDKGNSTNILTNTIINEKTNYNFPKNDTTTASTKKDGISFLVILISVFVFIIFVAITMYKYLVVFDSAIILTLVITTIFIIRDLLNNNTQKIPFNKVTCISRTTIILATPIVVAIVYLYIAHCAGFNAAGLQLMEHIEQNNLSPFQTICYLLSNSDKLPNIFIFSLNITIQIISSILVTLMQLALLFRGKAKNETVNKVLNKLLNFWYVPIVLLLFPVIALILRNFFPQ